MHLTSAEEVEHLLYASMYREEVTEAISILQVHKKIPTSPFRPVRESYGSIRALLDRSRNITDLVLHFSLSLKPICVFPTANVFNGLVALDVNIPHATLASFLQSHPRIEVLVLGPCNNTQQCPLTGCHLPSLQHITCPPSCVRALTIDSHVSEIFTTHDNIQHPNYPLLQLLNFRPIATLTFLTCLHIDIDDTVPDILQRISAVAPRLKLKLTQSKFSHEVYFLYYHGSCHTDNALQQAVRMPWNNPNYLSSWENGLHLLQHLQRFLLRSWHPLRASDNDEDLLVRRWLFVAPPSLKNVVIWTGAWQNLGRLIKWDFEWDSRRRKMGWQKNYEQKASDLRALIDELAFN